jgi:hypothetical protein
LATATDFRGVDLISDALPFVIVNRKLRLANDVDEQNIGRRAVKEL